MRPSCPNDAQQPRCATGLNLFWLCIAVAPVLCYGLWTFIPFMTGVLDFLESVDLIRSFYYGGLLEIIEAWDDMLNFTFEWPGARARHHCIARCLAREFVMSSCRLAQLRRVYRFPHGSRGADHAGASLSQRRFAGGCLRMPNARSQVYFYAINLVTNLQLFLQFDVSSPARCTRCVLLSLVCPGRWLTFSKGPRSCSSSTPCSRS